MTNDYGNEQHKWNVSANKFRREKTYPLRPGMQKGPDLLAKYRAVFTMQQNDTGNFDLKKYSSTSSVVDGVNQRLSKDRKLCNRLKILGEKLIKGQSET